MSRGEKPSDGAAGKQDLSMGCCRQAEELQSLSHSSPLLQKPPLTSQDLQQQAWLLGLE